jgi:prepilin-type N-terminal cleavage/methylation domain-containing protein
MTDRRGGFTFVEVLTCLLVLALGMMAAIGVARYALRLTHEAMATSLALPTARTVMADIRLSGPAVLDVTTTAGVTTGYVNGLYVRRTLLDVNPVGKETFATVRVEVFWSGDSARILTVQERMVFHAL